VTVKFRVDDDDADDEQGDEDLENWLVKPCSTMLVGSSVQFELALLTLCFLLGPVEAKGATEVKFHLGSERVVVKCFGMRQRYGPEKIGTAYLEQA